MADGRRQAARDRPSRPARNHRRQRRIERRHARRARRARRDAAAHDHSCRSQSREGPRDPARVRARARHRCRDPGRGPRAGSGAAGLAGRSDRAGIVVGRVRVALPGRPAARAVALHRRQPGADVADQRRLRLVADRHGDLLQDHAERRRAQPRADGRSLRHRAGDHRPAARRGPHDRRASGDVHAAIARGREEDRMARRPRRGPGAPAAAAPGRVPDPRAAAPRARHGADRVRPSSCPAASRSGSRGVLVRAHNPAIAIGVALGAIALAATRGRAQIAAASIWWWRVPSTAARSPMACAVAIAAIATGWAWGTHVAGGSDSYCYLNEAELLAGGHARQLQPDAANIPWPDSRWAFVPGGSRAGSRSGRRGRADLPFRISAHDGGRARDRRPRRHVLDRPADGRPGRVADVRPRPAHRRSGRRG